MPNEAATGEDSALQAKRQELISVVVPCGEESQFLKEALRSLILQSYPHWEAVIVASSDSQGASKVVGELQKEFPKCALRFLEERSKGRAAALNSGIRAARGSYILPLNPNDMLTPDALETLITLQTARGETCVAFGSYQLFGQEQKLIVSADSYSLERHRWSDLISYSALYPRSVWELTPGYCTDISKGYENWDLWLKLQSCGIDFCGTRKVTLICRAEADLAESKAKRDHDKLFAQIVHSNPELYPPRDVLAKREMLRKHGFLKAAKSEHIDQCEIMVVSFFAAPRGGSEILARDISEALAESEVQVELAYVVNDPSAEVVVQAIGEQRVKAHAVSGQAGQIQVLLQSRRPKGVIVLADAGGPLLNAFQNISVPEGQKLLYLNINNEHYDYMSINRPLWEMAAAQVRSFDQVAVFYEEGEAAQFLRENQIPFNVVVNGVPPLSTEQQGLAAELGLPAEARLLVYPGLVAPKKNQIALLRQASKLPEGCHLLFLGDIWPDTREYAAEFLKLIEQTPNAHYLGPQPREIVSWVMQEATACLFPSISEGAPLTLREAMSHSLPWMATPEVGFAKELKGGFVGAVEDFPRFCQQLVDDPIRAAALGREGLKQFREQHSIRHVARQLQELLQPNQKIAAKTNPVKVEASHVGKHAASDAPLPIIFIASSMTDRFKYCMVQAKAWNPASRVIILGADSDSGDLNFIEYYPFQKYLPACREFNQLYKHYSTNSPEEERFRFQRWFILNSFMEERGLEACMHLDQDVLVYLDIDEEAEQRRGQDMIICANGEPHYTFTTRKCLQQFCGHLVQTYQNSDSDKFRSWIAEFEKEKLLGGSRGINDKVVLRDFAKRDDVRVGDFNHAINGSMHACSLQGTGSSYDFEIENGMKRIVWKGLVPHGRITSTGELMRFKSLYFQGESKRLIPDFFRTPEVGG